MKNILLGLRRWLFRRGGGFDFLSGCVAIVGLTIMISQKLWSEWPLWPGHLPLQKYIRTWPYALALLAVYGIEAWALNRRLRAIGHSIWWTVPVMLTVIAFAGCPPHWTTMRLVLVAAFIVYQIPLFLDRSEEHEHGDTTEKQ